MTKFTLHVLGVPHTKTTPEFNGCAFTAKVLKFCRMMHQRGHRVIHYGHQDSQVECSEHVTVTTNATLEAAYGDYRWKELGFAHYYRTDDLAHKTFHANSIKEIEKRKQPNDILLCFWGWGHKPIADAHPDLIAIEPGIGYGGAWARWRVYESHSVMNCLAGPRAVSECLQDWYHVVIPNYFDLDDFTYETHKQDYILYLGRIYSGKGVDIAIDAAQKAGKKLIIAGQGTLKAMGYSTVPDHVTEFGYAGSEDRRRLLKDASALFIASRYAEPFGGVQVEAWMSGTPVISPDWAAFAEFNQHGVTGYRCRTFKDFVTAIESVDQIRPRACRLNAAQFTFDHIAPQYERYFQDVTDVYTGQGWYQQ
jgi:glycosyltransferase involved in cell wall biosynthesis